MLGTVYCITVSCKRLFVSFWLLDFIGLCYPAYSCIMATFFLSNVALLFTNKWIVIVFWGNERAQVGRAVTIVFQDAIFVQNNASQDEIASSYITSVDNNDFLHTALTALLIE
jgi:hypothetical protein